MRFRYFEDKVFVMRNTFRLKGTDVYVNENYSEQTLRQRQSLIPLLSEMKKIDPKAHLIGAKLVSKGRQFSVNNANELPIIPHNVSTITKSNVTLFSGRFSQLSNLYPIQLEIDDRTWSSVEHYYQFSKAMDANNQQAAHAILVTTDPVEAMAIGRHVTASAQWNQVTGPEKMKKAQLIKFKIPAMALSLKNTGLFIGEATRNPLWGIGKTLSENSAFESRSWSGANTTGQILKEVRKILSLDHQIAK